MSIQNKSTASSLHFQSSTNPLQGSATSPPQRIASPFDHLEAVLPTASRRSSNLLLWIVLGLLLVIVCGFGGTYLARTLQDPLRTMEEFPTGKYFDGYHALAGARFKSELRVEADLGWRDGVGRLMLFSTPSDSRPIGVMIPGSLGNIYFVKGQTYLAELEVKEGGLIYAHSCKKN